MRTHFVLDNYTKKNLREAENSIDNVSCIINSGPMSCFMPSNFVIPGSLTASDVFHNYSDYYYDDYCGTIFKVDICTVCHNYSEYLSLI